MSLRPTLAFLEVLGANNTKEWFDDNRGQYEQAREAFEQFIVAVIAEFHRVDDVGPLEPKEVIHRINRDVRFSKDNTKWN